MTSRRIPREALPRKEICRILIMAMTLALSSAFVPCQIASPGRTLSSRVSPIFLSPPSSTPPSPSSSLFNSDIIRVTSRKSMEAPYQAIAMLRQMRNLYKTGHRTARPDRETYIIILESLARLSKFQSRMGRRVRYRVHNSIDDPAMVAVELHSEMVDFWMEEDKPSCLEPNTDSLNSVLHCLAKNSSMIVEDYSSCLGAERMMEDMFEGGLGLGSLPNTKSFEFMIEAWGRCSSSGDKEGHASKKADEWLKRMECLYEEEGSGSSRYRPSIRCYNLVIDAYGRSGEPGACFLAENVLRRIRDLPTFPDDAILALTPTLGTYTATILALSRSGHERNAAMRATELLDRYISICESNADLMPEITPFNAVISAWVKSKEDGSPQKAEQILRRMDTLSKSHANFRQIKPDLCSYNAAINAYVKKGTNEALLHAETLFHEMERLNLPLDIFTFNTLLSKTISPTKAEEYIHRMIYHNVKPTVKNFSKAISAWAKSNDKEAASRAESLLVWMESLHQQDKSNHQIKPDVITYTCVIECFAKSKKPDSGIRAQRLIEKMLLLQMDARKGNNPDMMPNVRTFTSVILAHANSRQKGCAANAYKVLEQMKDLSVKPNIFSLNYVLLACGNEKAEDDSAKRKKILGITLLVFKRIRKSDELCSDSFTYAFLMKAITAQMSSGEERDKFMKRIFEECCNEGYLSDEVLFRLRRACKLDYLGVILGKDYSATTVRKLPPAWSRNMRR